MSGSVNKVILVGHLGRDPEIRTTQAGKRIASLSVATGEKWHDKHSGEPKERTQWHRVVILNGLSQVAEKYLKKGDKVYLEGAMHTRKWTDNDGQDRYVTEVVLTAFNGVLTMLDAATRSNGSSARQDDTPASAGQAYRPPHEPLGGDMLDDEIPF